MADFTQTKELNAPLIEEVEIARSMLRNAEEVLDQAIIHMFPVGAKVYKTGFRGSRTYYTVAAHSRIPSRGMQLLHRSGNYSFHDMTSRHFELCEFSYVLSKISSQKTNEASHG